MQIQKNYDVHVTPYTSTFSNIKLSAIKSKELKDFSHELANYKIKSNDKYHKVDNSKSAKRKYTGFAGEAALEQFLHVEFSDLSFGDSYKYAVSDLTSIGLNIGVKTVEYGKYPTVMINSKKPEIIILKMDDLNFCICGYASVFSLNRYQTIDLILDPNLKKLNTKAGFWGFRFLCQFPDLNHLKSF